MRQRTKLELIQLVIAELMEMPIEGNHLVFYGVRPEINEEYEHVYSRFGLCAMIRDMMFVGKINLDEKLILMAILEEHRPPMIYPTDVLEPINAFWWPTTNWHMRHKTNEILPCSPKEAKISRICFLDEIAHKLVRDEKEQN